MNKVLYLKESLQEYRKLNQNTKYKIPSLKEID